MLLKIPVFLKVASLLMSVSLILLIVSLAWDAIAQENATENTNPIPLPEGVALSVGVCEAPMIQAWTTATIACINKPEGYICNGGTAPFAQPQGAVSSALASMGALVDVNVVDIIETSPIRLDRGEAGIAYLRLSAPINLTMLMIGDVEARDMSPPDFPSWQSVAVHTNPSFPLCGASPLNMVVFQSPNFTSSRIVVNGASLSLNGTVVVITTENSTIFIALTGLAAVTVFGQEQVFYAGHQVSVPFESGAFMTPSGRATPSIPYDPILTRNLPVSLLDRPILIPQSGTVTTQGSVNLRSEPDIYAGVILQINSGEILSVLGRTEDSQWFHVRRVNGESGWMSANLLLQNTGYIDAVYQATPIPPQRFGELGTTGRVLASSGVNLRAGPDIIFPAVATLGNDMQVNLLARSPYSPWLKIEAGGREGWVALVNLDTQSFIEGLPIDFNAPPLPPPTAIPGLFGNAFPDPNRDGN